MTASVDENCIGCGACASICPEIFRMNDEGLAEAYVNPVPGELEESAQEAADGCPTDAIHLD
ncbi:ferredoxin [Desulfitobacterium chlororespirans]|uniref:Ferredoxin n=1 Tax=Desulfitobacterium chlororespirans DSM 11544 TaxID=1121395 RepID=A0A1M7UHA6_9FIRM|nr:ferredoxin [Desulfitobacterium chlororespirans]SHN82411.1 ferredoxin [Desulfitobacterium chlororespirans DSM 11544]